jgi:hypothetical protein
LLSFSISASTLQRFGFGQFVELTPCALILEIVQVAQPLAHGGKVGQCAAEPALGDIELPGARRLFSDGFLRLLLGADEQHLVTCRDCFNNELVRFGETGDRFLKIDDVNAVARREDVRSHLWIPALGLVSEVRSRLKQCSHRNKTLRSLGHA